MSEVKDGDHTSEGELRSRFSDLLSRNINGFLEGKMISIRESAVRDLVRLGLPVVLDEVTLVIDDLPPRCMVSLHVDHAGEHYESTARNFNYWTGYEG